MKSALWFRKGTSGPLAAVGFGSRILILCVLHSVLPHIVHITLQPVFFRCGYQKHTKHVDDEKVNFS